MPELATRLKTVKVSASAAMTDKARELRDAGTIFTTLSDGLLGPRDRAGRLARLQFSDRRYGSPVAHAPCQRISVHCRRLA